MCPKKGVPLCFGMPADAPEAALCTEKREASFLPLPESVQLIEAAGKIYNGRCRIMRVKITLACTECKRRNYVSKKNKKNDPDRIEMMKHCRFCNKHTLHKETK